MSTLVNVKEGDDKKTINPTRYDGKTQISPFDWPFAWVDSLIIDVANRRPIIVQCSEMASNSTMRFQTVAVNIQNS